VTAVHLPSDPQDAAVDDNDALASAVDNFPGPAFILHADGGIGPCNAAAAELLETDSDWFADILQWLDAASVAPGLRSTPVRMPRGAMVIEWAAAHIDDDRTMLLGRDATLERQLRQTLTESRQRYKDLVEVSADFAWETGENGRFVFVSPKGALGFTAEALIGRDPQDLAIDEWGDLPLPFDTRRPVDQSELWLKTAEGTPACIVASAVPLLGPGGRWRGARGVCRDITEEALRTAELARVRNREKLLAHIVHTLRNRIDGTEALQEAAAETARAVGADGCRIYRAGEKHPFEQAAHFGSEPPDAPTDEALAGLLNGAANSEQPVVRDIDGFRTLAARCELRQSVNGAVVVWRAAEYDPWEEDDVQLIGGVADRVGLAHAHIAYQERLRRLSERDGLTGLFNRRTFFERLDEMLERPEIGSSALLYVDLDNFKAVNDLHGHAQGDAVLKAVGELLTAGVRPGDLPGRLGGDEFVLWVARCDLERAVSVAERLLNGVKNLQHLSAGPEKPLGLSIGIAVHTPGTGETVKELADRADGVMYVAKRGGKGNYAVAPGHQPQPAEAPAPDAENKS
jgi:diguanylate cyclase (GGDEF)-like protein/PAS domain S-box-containing protein